MRVKGILGGVGIAVGVAAVAELGASAYFFRRTYSSQTLSLWFRL